MQVISDDDSVNKTQITQINLKATTNLNDILTQINENNFILNKNKGPHMNSNLSMNISSHNVLENEKMINKNSNDIKIMSQHARCSNNTNTMEFCSYREQNLKKWLNENDEVISHNSISDSTKTDLVVYRDEIAASLQQTNAEIEQIVSQPKMSGNFLYLAK